MPTPTRSIILTLSLLPLASCATSQPITQPAAPLHTSPAFIHETTDQYTLRIIQGFKVRISQAALNHPSTTTPALKVLESQLKDTLAQTPKHTHKTLRKTTIWIEHNNPGFPCACYHPNPDWLAANGYNTDKERSIEISNTTNFVNWVNDSQPSMILHELAHAYQHATHGYNNPLITTPYQRAKDSGTYDLVDHVSGSKRPHYAMNNATEYFAELTESYFGRNDFYPFSREQLKAHDPDGYIMIQHAWGLRNSDK
ncbi:MAG: hypothetical protein ACSHX5_08320 [Phycisphaerales bacterium]